MLKARVAVAQAQQRERSATKDAGISRSRLNQLLDLDPGTRLELVDVDLSPVVCPPLAELQKRAEEKRPDYLSLDSSGKQFEEAGTIAKSRYYPHVSAFMQYYREGNDFFADRNDYTNNWNGVVGVRVDLNLFEGGKAKAQVSEMNARKLAVDEQRRDLGRRIALEVEDAYQQLDVARANIDTATAALRPAEDNERITGVQYREQLAIFLEVLNARVFAAQSRTDYYQAWYGYRMALADLDRAVGGGLIPGMNGDAP